MDFTASQLDQLVNTTLPFYIRDKVFGQSNQMTPAYDEMMSGKKLFPGGDQIVVSVKFDPQMAYELVNTPSQELNFTNPSPLKQAFYPWTLNHMGLTFSYAEALRAGFSIATADSAEGDGAFSPVSGQDKIRIQSFLDSKFEEMKFSMVRDFSKNRTWSDGTNGFAGIPAFIVDDPTTGVCGALSRVSNAKWRNRTLVGSSKISYSAANQTLTETLEAEMLQLRRFSDGNGPNKIYAGSNFIKALKVEARAKGSYTMVGFAKSETDTAIKEIFIMGVAVEYEPALDDMGYSGRAYFVDHKGIQLYMHGGDNMVLHFPERPYNVLSYHKSVTWSGAVVATQLNSSGVYEVDTTGL